MTALRIFVLALVIGSTALLGCKHSRAAAEKSLKKLEEQVDVGALRDWAVSITASQDPESAFTNAGKVMPQRFVRAGKTAPTLHLYQFGNGEWIIQVDGGFGMEFYGIALAREGVQFPQ